MPPSNLQVILYTATVVVFSCFCLVAKGQPVLKALPLDEPPGTEVKPPPPPPELKTGWQTQKEARALTLSIPAPRGQIVDRNGIPFAQSRVVQYLALSFPFLGAKAEDAQILAFAHDAISRANRTLGQKWNVSDERLLQHYKNRRWLPLVFSTTDGLNDEITEAQQERLQPLLKTGAGLVLQAAYLRYYPKGACAPHVIGYTGRTRPLPLGPVDDGQPIFEETDGRSGLEKTFDRELQGRPGSVNVLFNPDGSRLKEETLRRPAPGNNVVTTLDYNLQKITENALAKHLLGGSMVIIEVKTGDILAMASYPLYDLNLFVPGITTANYERLKNEKHEPLVARAFQGAYPPASTFKIIVSQAALESGKINARTTFECGTALQVGDRVFHNWSSEAEGSINVITAMKRSCNTWFFQAGLLMGAKPILDMAQRLGLGEKTGIQLEGESAGFLPSEAWTMQKLGHKMLGGDIANLSIGQGSTLVTPLQAARAMAALADGENMPHVRLVKQVQDVNDHVIQAFPSKAQRQVALNPEARMTVVKGMIAVVHGDRGTGHAAQISQCKIAGKTGTAQWKIKEDRNLAWFTGFLPAEDPVYAFAMVYEGQPGQKVHGGSEAAPIVRQVFDNYFKNAPPDEPVLLAKNNPSTTRKAQPVDDDEDSGEMTRKALPVNGDGAPSEPLVQERSGGFGGFFRNLFRR
jgi:penicillin-binding protein 2